MKGYVFFIITMKPPAIVHNLYKWRYQGCGIFQQIRHFFSIKARCLLFFKNLAYKMSHTTNRITTGFFV